MIPSFPSVSPECVASGGLTPSVAATVWPAGAALEGGAVAPSAAAFAQWLGASAPVAGAAVATPQAVSVKLTRPTAAPADSRSADFASVHPGTALATPVAPDLANAMPVQDQPDRAETEAACALLAPLLQLGTPVAPCPVAGESSDTRAIAGDGEILPRTDSGDESALSANPRTAGSWSPVASAPALASASAPELAPAPALTRDEGRAGEFVRPVPSGTPAAGTAVAPTASPLVRGQMGGESVAPGQPRAESADVLLTTSSRVTTAAASASPDAAEHAPAAPAASDVLPAALPSEPATGAGPAEAARTDVAPAAATRFSAFPHSSAEIFRAPSVGANSVATATQPSVAVETPEGIQIFASLLPASSAAERPVTAARATSTPPASASPLAPAAVEASVPAASSAGADTHANPPASPAAAAHPQGYTALLRAAAPVSGQVRRGDPERPAISAAPAVAAASAEKAAVSVAEKKSLTPRGASVKPATAEAGIAVAQEQSAMSSAVIAPNPAAPASAVRAEAIALPVAPTSFPTGEPAAPSTGAALAHRAVEAVETVVDAQAAARLEPTPGVALRFRAGHEELAVRIEWRAGQVHTEFRTDSEEWRTAVAHEWRAVTARPDSALRSAEAVFAPASGTSDGSSASGFSSHSGQSSSQQQQQSQHQQHAAGREAPEIFGRVGRRFPAAPASVAAPSAIVAPLGAHRLSAVA